MGLRNRESAPAAAPTTPAPASASLPAAAPVPAPSATGAHPAAMTLPELRAKLAGGLTGGTNPPEASLPDALIEPRTRETPDGGAEPGPGWKEEKGKMVRDTFPGPTGTASSGVGPLPSTPAVEESRRKRRTKAETEAARPASAGPAKDAPEVAPIVLVSSPSGGAVSGGDVSELATYTSQQLVNELRSRLDEGTSLTIHARMV